jgi:hypothetical protein
LGTCEAFKVQQGIDQPATVFVIVALELQLVNWIQQAHILLHYGTCYSPLQIDTKDF